MRVIEAMVMPGGWHFIQDGDKITAETYKELITAVLQYRAERRIAIGNVQVDVDNFICGKYPDQCQASHSPAVIFALNQAKTQSKRLVDSINEWANDLSEKSLKYAYPGDAEQRANICLNCPHQKSWEGECAPCGKNTNHLLAILRGGRDLRGHFQKLKGCGALKMCTRTAVWLDKDFLPATETAPDGCWLKVTK